MDDRAGGSHRRNDASRARNPGRLSAPRGAPQEGYGLRETFHVKQVGRSSAPSDLASDRSAALELTPVSRETAERLDRYLALLREWQAKTNLVAPSTLLQLWTRHVADSLQLLNLAPSAKTWADLGSGGGFPGVVLACALAELPGTMVHLVERNGKKAA